MRQRSGPGEGLRKKKYICVQIMLKFSRKIVSRIILIKKDNWSL
jgi:hypothetical protein